MFAVHAYALKMVLEVGTKDSAAFAEWLNNNKTGEAAWPELLAVAGVYLHFLTATKREFIAWAKECEVDDPALAHELRAHADKLASDDTVGSMVRLLWLESGSRGSRRCCAIAVVGGGARVDGVGRLARRRRARARARARYLHQVYIGESPGDVVNRKNDHNGNNGPSRGATGARLLFKASRLGGREVHSILVAVTTSDPERYALEAVLVDVLPSYCNRGPGGQFHREYWLGGWCGGYDGPRWSCALRALS